jgi:hypothetical protein|tara:strand:+ start:10010 stop:10129 length:120 start_codon:yes stop_codon:yes gene_type:complete
MTLETWRFLQRYPYAALANVTDESRGYFMVAAVIRVLNN